MKTEIGIDMFLVCRLCDTRLQKMEELRWRGGPKCVQLLLPALLEKEYQCLCEDYYQIS